MATALEVKARRVRVIEEGCGRMRYAVVGPCWAVLALTASCGSGGNGASATRTPSLVSIALSPLTVTLAPGATQQLSVVGTYSDQTTHGLSSGETFATSNPALATVNSTGLVTVPATATSGTVAITATDAATGIATSAAESTSITVTPVAGSAPTSTSVSAASATATNNALCTAVQPFYWEIGDQNGTLASGSVGVSNNAGQTCPTGTNSPSCSPNSTLPAGLGLSATTKVTIGAASKMIYGTYVVQIRGGVAALSTGTVSSGNPTGTVGDVDFLHLTSGFTNIADSGTACPTSLVPLTVNQCLTLSNADGGAYHAQNAADIGVFHYDGGHMENHASQLTTLGNIANAQLAATLLGPLNLPNNGLVFFEPLLSGGLYGAPTDYIQVLKGILSGTLLMKGALGTSPVCTNPGGDYSATGGPSACSATFSPVGENWHYSIGHWVEDDPAVNGDGAFSSPGDYGFYPWIDATKTYYGVLSRDLPPDTNGISDQGSASASCGRLIRHAFVTGGEQTGTIPAN